MENGHVESFNGRFRDECLNENWFSDLADAREKIAQWKQDYNEKRPHSSLQYRTPVEFAAQSAAGFYRAELGQEASNAGPLPQTPIPAMLRTDQTRRKSHYLWTRNGGQVRGEAYLVARQGVAAAAEFQKVIDHPGLVVNEPIGALAHLGLARAYALSHDSTRAKTEYQDFLLLWKDADPDIPILKQAKAEYVRLQ